MPLRPAIGGGSYKDYPEIKKTVVNDRVEHKYGEFIKGLCKPE